MIGETAAAAMLKAFDERGIEPKGKSRHAYVSGCRDSRRAHERFKAYMAEHAPDLECLDTLYNENDVNNAQSNVETQISTYGDELIGLYGGKAAFKHGKAALAPAGLVEQRRHVFTDGETWIDGQDRQVRRPRPA